MVPATRHGGRGHTKSTPPASPHRLGSSTPSHCAPLSQGSFISSPPSSPTLSAGRRVTSYRPPPPTPHTHISLMASCHATHPLAPSSVSPAGGETGGEPSIGGDPAPRPPADTQSAWRPAGGPSLPAKRVHPVSGGGDGRRGGKGGLPRPVGRIQVRPYAYRGACGEQPREEDAACAIPSGRERYVRFAERGARQPRRNQECR